MFSNDFYSALSSIVTGPLSFLYVVILTLEWRFSARVMRVVIPSFIGLLSAGSALYFTLCGVNDATKLHAAMAAIASFVLFNLFLSRYPLLQMLSTYTTACIFTFLSDTLCGIFVPAAGPLHVLAKAAIFLLIGGLLLCFFRRPLLEVQRELQRRKWLWMMAVPLLMCFVFFYVVQMQGPLYEDPAFRPVVLALCFCVVSVYVAFYFVLRSLQKQYQMQNEADVLQVHLSALKKHAGTMKDMGEQFHLLRHDLRHYLRMQQMCLENGDLAGMGEALDALSQYIDGAPGGHWLHQYTGLPLFDAVLSYYAGQAAAAGIAFNVDLSLPQALGDVPELAVLLSNAVENACDACRTVAPPRGREIALTGGTQGGQFLLEVANTCADDVEFDAGRRPGPRRPGHGYGTQSMASFAEKYHAHLSYRAAEGWFRLRLLMPLPEAGLEKDQMKVGSQG